MIRIKSTRYTNSEWWNKNKNAIVEVYYRIEGSGGVHQKSKVTGEIILSEFTTINYVDLTEEKGYVVYLKMLNNSRRTIKLTTIESVKMFTPAEKIIYKLEYENKK